MNFILLLSVLCFSEPLSIHRIEYERHRNFVLPEVKEFHRPMDLKPREKALYVTVYGFLPVWELSNASYIKWQDLSHVACFGIEFDSTGNIIDFNYWPSGWTSVIDSAHANGVKVHLVAIAFGYDTVSAIVRNHRTETINTILAQVEAGNADGVNIDFESPYAADSAYFALFLEELADTMHAHGYEVTVCFTAVNWYNRYETARIADAVDGIFIMAYDYYYSGSSTSGPVSPLTGGTYNVTNSVNSYIVQSNYQPRKFILGVPYYGYKWPTEDSSPYSTTLGSGTAQIYSSAIVSAETYGLLWDTLSQTVWYRYYDNVEGKWYQCWFDNDSSLGLKYDLAIQKSLQGVGMWALGYDAGRDELWYALESHFSEGIPPSRPIGFNISQPGPRALKLSWYSSDTESVSYEVWESTDGVNFSYVLTTTNNSYYTGVLEPGTVHFYKVRAVNVFGVSEFTNVLGGVAWDTPIKILLVDGVDREAGTINTRDFVVDHGLVIHSLGLPFISTSNECVEDSVVILDNFETVDWILGEEGTATMSFGKKEEELVKSYLENGGNLFVSGSEIGYDLVAYGDSGDIDFYQNYLKAYYQGDDAGTYSVIGVTGTIFDGLGPFQFDNGTWNYDVDYPDGVTAYGGSTVCLRYYGGTGWDAGIQYEGTFGTGDSISRLVYIGIPFECIDPAVQSVVMARILNFFGYPVEVEEHTVSDAKKLKVWPNPVKDVLWVRPANGEAGVMEIFDFAGRKVLEEKIKGITEIKIGHLKPGVYFYVFRSRDVREKGKIVILR